MMSSRLRTFLVLAVFFNVVSQPLEAQQASSPAEKAGFEALTGQWVRPDGGYTVTIESVDSNGQLKANYANPQPLPFEKAKASREGESVNVFLELTAGGYNGSTYTLTYDPKNDILKGVYYQAVAQQSFNVYFVRVK